ncbi:MAG: hypothetical protein H7A51_09490 [Akkermansiaceae bacterium]|nr:hypothetical protein [Akkermansiaceae bacterium]
MDALTNVVAVLILVLILVQADVSQKVVQFLEGLLPATPEEVVASTQKVEELEKKKLKIKNLLSEDAPTPEDIETEQRQLALLEKQTKENKKLLVEISELIKLEEKTRKERDDENKKTSAIQKEIARLEALLDATPPVKAPPPAEVSIPISRSIPKSAEIYYAIVVHDRVHFIDPFTPVELFEAEFKKHKRKWLVERIKRQGADRYIYNQAKIAEHFKNFDFKNSRKQTVRLLANPLGTRMRIEIKPDLKAGGTALADINNRESTYFKILKKLANNNRAVILYHVNPNSFNTYLQARILSDKAGIAAGWEINYSQAHSIVLADVEVKRLQDPPPPDPNAKPKPPKPPKPPRIDPKLD